MTLHELFEEDLKLYSCDRFTAFLDETTLERFVSAAESVSAGPTAAELAAAPLLENWFARWQRDVALIGSVSGHPRLPDTDVTTSRLLFISDDRKCARTLSRWYRLGTHLSDGKKIVDPQLIVECPRSLLAEYFALLKVVARDRAEVFDRPDLLGRLRTLGTSARYD